MISRPLDKSAGRRTGMPRTERCPWRISKIKWVNIALPDAYFSSLALLFPESEPAQDQPTRADRIRMLRGLMSPGPVEPFRVAWINPVVELIVINFPVVFL